MKRNAGGEGEMLTPALGKVRAAGTCSFVTGVVAYCALATSFLWRRAARGVYKAWLLFAAGSAPVIGVRSPGAGRWWALARS